jgi:hypothetical protein
MFHHRTFRRESSQHRGPLSGPTPPSHTAVADPIVGTCSSIPSSMTARGCANPHRGFAESAAPAAAPGGATRQHEAASHRAPTCSAPAGAAPVTHDGPIILRYRDPHQSLTFPGNWARVDSFGPDIDPGTRVSVTLQSTSRPRQQAVYWATATLLMPRVVLAAGQPAAMQTELITAVHDNPALTGFGAPRRDNSTVTPLTGQASNAPLPAIVDIAQPACKSGSPVLTNSAGTGAGVVGGGRNTLPYKVTGDE